MPPFEELSDEELMERIQSLSDCPDESSGASERMFKELYRRTYSHAYNFCRYYGLRHNDAMEALQDAFVKVFQYSASFQRGKKFKPWFFKILFNKIQDKFNELKKNKYSDIEEYTDFMGAESTAINSFQNRELLSGMIYKLPMHLRQVVLLYAFEEMDFESIGQAVGLSSRHARNRLDEALKEMQRMTGATHEYN